MTNQKPKSNVSSRTNLSRACVFIDSSNPSMPYQVIDSKVRPLIKLPFPPVIDPADLVAQQSNGNIPTRAPNAFIIYRKAFIDAAHVDGYHLPMRIMSSMASQSWEQESDTVKSEYRRLANEAFNLRNEMYPKSGFRRKRAKWNIVSFKNKNKVTKKRQKWNIVSFDSKKSNVSSQKDESKRSVETPSSEVFQPISSSVRSPFPSPLSQDESNKEIFFANFNNDKIFPSTEINLDKVNEIPCNDELNQDFVYQNLIPSPELSTTSSFSPQMNDQIEYDLDFCYPEQPLDGMIHQDDEQLNFQPIENDHPFNYYQVNNNPTLPYDDENALNETLSSQNYFVNFQSANIETNALHSYNNGNYLSDGLGVGYFHVNH